jgi:poly-gamma-glutamate synthesis protein (capsule biosynthesis protein)
MTGRGVDQILPHPGNPKLHESNVQDAREYVALAERVNGPIRRPVDFPYVWGDALDELNRAGVDARVANLETSVTSSDDAWPGKGIHYRMHPRNVGCITAAKIDYCGLANNHVLDWGHRGLDETLRTLDQAGIAHAGAGRTAADVERPAVIDVGSQHRLLIFACATGSSGVPRDWEATRDRPGVRLLPNLSTDTARGLTAQLRQTRRAGDVAIVSINKAGHVQTDVAAIELHVKDQAKGGWAFYGVDAKGETRKIPANSACDACHGSSGAVDTTFVQFYPTLIEAAKKAGTLKTAAN